MKQYANNALYAPWSDAESSCECFIVQKCPERCVRIAELIEHYSGT